MRRGDIYRIDDAIAERGAKPGYYLIVSRDFVALHDDMSTVVCAPIYSQVLGLETELVVGPEQGVHHTSSVRCDMLTLVFKHRVGRYVGRLTAEQVVDLDRALIVALQIQVH